MLPVLKKIDDVIPVDYLLTHFPKPGSCEVCRSAKKVKRQSRIILPESHEDHYQPIEYGDLVVADHFSHLATAIAQSRCLWVSVYG